MQIVLLLVFFIYFLDAKKEQRKIKFKSNRILKCSRRLTKGTACLNYFSFISENSSIHIVGEICCSPEIEEIFNNVEEVYNETLGDTSKAQFQ